MKTRLLLTALSIFTLIFCISCTLPEFKREPVHLSKNFKKPKTCAVIYVINDSKEKIASIEAQDAMQEQLNKKFYKLLPLKKVREFIKKRVPKGLTQPEDMKQMDYDELGVDAVFFGKVFKYHVDDSMGFYSAFVEIRWVLYNTKTKERMWEDKYEAKDEYMEEPKPEKQGESIMKRTCQKCTSKILETLPN